MVVGFIAHKIRGRGAAVNVRLNFGEKPFETKQGGKTWRLPQNGFAVEGPRIEQFPALVDGKSVTTIRTDKFQFTETQ